ncbi:hypothetical protein FQR65_LT07379 [Abscondita terminalis]|nr:hypothetical protein FQR65_LT07379 [Abscondita terminalis]
MSAVTLFRCRRVNRNQRMVVRCNGTNGRREKRRNTCRAVNESCHIILLTPTSS